MYVCICKCISVSLKMSFCEFIYYDIKKEPYIFMDQNQVESKILKTQQHQPPLYFRYIDDIFFI